MTKKKIALIAAGWAGCTALAFWAGTHWNAENASSSDKARRTAAMQQAGLAGEANAHGAGQASAGAKEGLVGGKAIRDLTPKETAARVKEIFAIEDPQQRMEAYLEFMKAIQGSEQMAVAMETMTENGFNNRERGREFSMLMTRWAKEDPQSALAWTQTHDDWRSKWGTGTALSVWAQSDPTAALAWAEAHPNKDKDEGNFHLVSVIGSIAKSNLDLAAQLSQNMDRSSARGDAMDRVLEQYFKQRGGDAAKEMVMGLPDGPYKNGILGRLADRLASTDVKSAAAWAASLPDGEAKPRIVATVINEWAEKNPNDAGAWLNALPASAAMDEPRERFAYKVQERDPEAAMAWANTITDADRRNQTAFRVAREWMNREPDNARAWVNTSQLPADMKERLINRRRG
jgi:hypothetical protein